MAQIEVVCPSGLSGIVRGLRMNEFKLFSDRKGLKSGAVWDEITKACWVETLDRGPYAQDPMWSSTVLQGDRLYALLAIRRASHGNAFNFDIPCPAPGCDEMIRWSVDLSEALKVKPYPKATLEAHAAGKPFVTTLGGRRVEYGMLTAADEKLMKKFVDRYAEDESDHLIVTLAFRCKRVAGLDEKQDVIDWIGSLELGDVLAFRDEMDANTGGVDTAFHVKCSECGARPEVELPFGGKDFWTPTKKAGFGKSSRSPSSSSDAPTSGSGEKSSISSATSDTEAPGTE